MINTFKRFVLMMVFGFAAVSAFGYERQGGYLPVWNNTVPETVLTMPSVKDVLSKENINPENISLIPISVEEYDSFYTEELGGKSLFCLVVPDAIEVSKDGCGQFVYGLFGEGVTETWTIVLFNLDCKGSIVSYCCYKIGPNLNK